MIRTSIFFLFILLSFLHAEIPDAPFKQEYHVPFLIGKSPDENDVRALVVDNSENVWAATRAGLFCLDQNNDEWMKIFPEANNHSIFCLAEDQNGIIWAGAWDGLYRIEKNNAVKIKGINEPISAIAANGKELLALGPLGQWYIKNGEVVNADFYCPGSVRNITLSKVGGYWISTGVGLFHHGAGKDFFLQNTDELLSADIADVAYTQNGDLWIAGLGGVTVYRNGHRIRTIYPKDGIPATELTCIETGPDGIIWIGTVNGMSRYDGENWSVRHSRRWLLNDKVRDLKFDKNGTAWIATADGVSAIKNRQMSLLSKANHFQRILEARHVREPGLVEKCRLTIPGDTTTWEPRDDDNDGQYTAMYLAMESYRYAATKSPEALKNAHNAFHALKFLQDVTDTPGFIARTVIPPSWTQMADPNRTLTHEELGERLVNNPRDKYVPNLWRLSKEGKWRWKGDTSSDEMSGHMYGYWSYFTFAATESEKQIVEELVCKIVDYIIDNGYNLKDIDGRHTKWGVWSPEKLLGDADWTPERYINSVEILSFLKLAWLVSGNQKYQNEYEKLLYDYGYVNNIINAKTFNPAFRTHIDDELLALAYPCLLFNETDPNLLALYHESVEKWYRGVQHDQTAFFNFLYSAMLGKEMDLLISVESLRDASLDLVRWKIDNSKREDLELVRSPELDGRQTSRLVPPSERCMMRMDKNPWLAVQGDGGHTESDGVWYLLPYWMGRYYGYIESPKD